MGGEVPVMRKRMVPLPDGKTAEATVLTFRTSSEEWNEYLLEDGTVLKLKAVATEVFRVDGAFDPQGNPLYILQSQNVMGVSAPAKLMRDASGTDDG